MEKNNKDFRLRYLLIPAAAVIFLAFCVTDELKAGTVSGAYAAEPTAAVSPAAEGGTATTAPTSGASGTVTPVPSTDASGTSTPSPIPQSTTTPTPLPTSTPTPTPTPTPIPDEPSEGAKISFISAYYDGNTVVVGDKFDTDKLVVSLHYDDGTVVQTKDYSVTETIVKQNGSNMYVVMSHGLTETFFVNGKSVKNLSVDIERYSFTIGNAPDERDLTVIAQYSDESSEVITHDYTVSPELFTTTGTQNITVTYHGKTAETSVYVKEPPAIKTVSLFYQGSDIYVDTEIERSDLTVNAVFDDNTTERITTYVLKTPKYTNEGDQKLTVEYMGKTTSITVKVKALEPLSMRAEYTGDDVFIGTEYDPRYLHVYLTYNNGKEGEIEDYKVYNTIIRYFGENKVKIYYGNFQTEVIINGCEMGEPDFTYVSTVDLTSNNYSISIDAAIPKTLDQDVTKIAAISKARLKHLYRRLNTTTESYLGFKYGFADSNNEKCLPINVRITLPDGFEPAYTDLYYSPNSKTILGCMNKMGVDDHTLEITIYRAGVYLLVYDPEAYNAGAEEETEEEEDDFYF